MKKTTTLLIMCFLVHNFSFAQCNFNPTITTNGSSSSCNSASVVLTVDSGSVSDSWTQRLNLAANQRNNATGFSIGSKGYLGTGQYSGTTYNDFWEYNPGNNTWTQKANIGTTTRYFSIAYNIGSKGYVGTGRSFYGPNYYNDFWEYDTATNSWAQKANFGGTARYGAVGFSIGAKGYIGTGYDGTLKKDFWEYDPGSNSWTQKADFGGTARYAAVGFSIDSTGYLGTGWDNTTRFNDFWEYNPVNNTWTQNANFGGTARYGAVGFSIGSKGFVGTGADPIETNDFWEYDPVNDTWIQRANFGGYERRYATGFSIGEKGYIGTGHQSSNIWKDFWEYHPQESYLWSTGGIGKSVAATTSGIYSVTVTSITGCSGSASISIMINPNLNIPTTTSASSALTCDGMATVNINGGVPPYTYLWSTSPAQTDDTASGLCAGTYYVTVTDSDSCFAVTSCVIDYQGSGMYENGIKNNILIYPNPAYDRITIEDVAAHQDETYAITNIQGRLLMQQLLRQSITEIDIHSLAPGMYFIRFESKEGSVVRKVIKK
jgi:hypothetical protein